MLEFMGLFERQMIGTKLESIAPASPGVSCSSVEGIRPRHDRLALFAKIYQMVSGSRAFSLVY